MSRCQSANRVEISDNGGETKTVSSLVLLQQKVLRSKLREIWLEKEAGRSGEADKDHVFVTEGFQQGRTMFSFEFIWASFVFQQLYGRLRFEEEKEQRQKSSEAIKVALLKQDDDRKQKGDEKLKYCLKKKTNIKEVDVNTIW